MTPARVAQAEGISERYLQKLFEAAATASPIIARAPAPARLGRSVATGRGASSVSEIAYSLRLRRRRAFQSAFRDRFGLSPRAFRQQEAERNSEYERVGQRGWPQDALAQPRDASSAASARSRSSPQPAGCSQDIGRSKRTIILAVEAERVHWGYFSRALRPLIEIASGDTVTVETLTQHASDDPELMIRATRRGRRVPLDAGQKSVDRRGAGPMDASIYGRGAGEGFGVHICTGPIAVKDAEPGDVLEVRILDIAPRAEPQSRVTQAACSARASRPGGATTTANFSPSRNRARSSRSTRSLTTADDAARPRALFLSLGAQTDPFGVVHRTYDYPGVPVAPGKVEAPRTTCSTASAFRCGRISA